MLNFAGPYSIKPGEVLLRVEILRAPRSPGASFARNYQRWNKIKPLAGTAFLAIVFASVCLALALAWLLMALLTAAFHSES